MPARLRLPPLLALVLLALGAQVPPAPAAAPQWTTYRHDAARSGFDPDSVTPVTPTRAWQTPALDGEVYAQPLVYGPDVYVATENDTIYALNAATGAVAWSTHLATPEPSSSAPCGNISPSIGITSTPVIDPTTNRIYAVGAVSASGAIRHELFALDTTSGASIAGFPITVDPPFPSGSGGKPVNQLQRAALALDNGRVLIGYGGNWGDCGTYWGWLVSAPTDGTTALSAFQAEPSYNGGAIWGGGNAPPIDSAGNVFVATGNGQGNSSSNPQYGESVIKLTSTASPLGSWAPSNWQSLDSSDTDIGSSMPTLLPGGYVFESGKDGNGYLLNGSLSLIQTLRGFCPGGSYGGSIFDSSNSTLYVACSGGLQALSASAGSPPVLAHKFSGPSGASGPPTIAGGLVWATNRSGNLYGLNLTTGAPQYHFTIPESGSSVNSFASPSAGGGRLFVASGNQVTAYTIAQAPGPGATTTSLTASSNPVVRGRPVTLLATVSPVPGSGTITFTDGGAAIAGCSGIAVTSGQAVCGATFSTAGRHTLAASYSGDGYDAASSATLVESVTGPPAISRASISPRRVLAGHRAVLRLTLSETAPVTVAITQVQAGHRAGRRCLTRRPAGRRCLVRVTLRRLHFQGRAGTNAFRLALRHLPSGHYRLFIYASDAAGRSTAIQLTFTVVRPRH